MGGDMEEADNLKLDSRQIGALPVSRQLIFPD